jgi:hypothetical protein
MACDDRSQFAPGGHLMQLYWVKTGQLGQLVTSLDARR